MKKLAVAFPDMKPDFFNLLAEQIDKTGFTTERLNYALNHVLNTFHYKQLTIADLMSVDVKCKIYSYQEMCNELKNGITTDHYAAIYFGDTKKPHYVLKIDKNRFNLPERL